MRRRTVPLEAAFESPGLASFFTQNEGKAAGMLRFPSTQVWKLLKAQTRKKSVANELNLENGSNDYCFF